MRPSGRRFLFLLPEPGSVLGPGGGGKVGDDGCGGGGARIGAGEDGAGGGGTVGDEGRGGGARTVEDGE